MGSYPIQDVDLTYKLYKIFKQKIKEQGLDNVMELENELLPCLLEMREQGVKIDLEGAIALDKQYTKEIDDLQDKLDKIAGRHVDVNIDDDLIYLCTHLSLEYKKTAKGNPCYKSGNYSKLVTLIAEDISSVPLLMGGYTGNIIS